MLEVGVEIPYKNRREYYNFIFEINKLVDSDGYIIFAVDNNPYKLETILLIKTNQNKEKILELIKDNNLKINNKKGVNEIINDLENDSKGWNGVSLAKTYSKDELEKLLESNFLFVEEKELEKRGFVKEHKKKNSIFISYSHKDKEVVSKLVSNMENAGLNLWIDKKEILPGDSILTKMTEGIETSKLGILLLSNNSAEGNYSNYEREQYLNKKISKNADIFLIRIDNVDINEKFPSLQYFSYIDLNTEVEDSFNEVIEKLKNKLNRLA